MTTAIRFDLAAAQDALARSDFGDDPLPGDAELIEAYEGYCQQEHGRYEQAMWDAQYERELQDWLSRRCPGCEDGGTGEVCYEHTSDDDASEEEPQTFPADWPPRDGDVWAGADGTRWLVTANEVGDEVRYGFHRADGNRQVIPLRLLELEPALRLVSAGWERNRYSRVEVAA